MGQRALQATRPECLAVDEIKVASIRGRHAAIEAFFCPGCLVLHARTNSRSMRFGIGWANSWFRCSFFTAHARLGLVLCQRTIRIAESVSHSMNRTDFLQTIGQ